MKHSKQLKEWQKLRAWGTYIKYRNSGRNITFEQFVWKFITQLTKI